MEKDLSVDALKALGALDDLESAIVQQQRAAAQPRPRRYALVPE